MRPSFHTPLGLYGGMVYTAFNILSRGKEPWTLHGKGTKYCEFFGVA